MKSHTPAVRDWCCSPALQHVTVTLLWPYKAGTSQKIKVPVLAAVFQCWSQGTACECPAPGKESAALSCGQNPSVGTTALPRGQRCQGEGSSTFQEHGASCRCWTPRLSGEQEGWSILTWGTLAVSKWWELGCSSLYLTVTSHSSKSTATLPKAGNYSSHTLVNSSICEQSLKPDPNLQMPHWESDIITRKQLLSLAAAQLSCHCVRDFVFTRTPLALIILYHFWYDLWHGWEYDYSKAWASWRSGHSITAHSTS